MEKGMLIEIIQMYRDNEQTLSNTVEAIDKYFSNLESRIKELEEEKTTELTVKYDGTFYVERTTNCCGVGMITTENYCPNCGRKIKK